MKKKGIISKKIINKCKYSHDLIQLQDCYICKKCGKREPLTK